jgi:phosphoenolpyruvate-protein phosphotransferase (PTS system enzyme I)
MTEAATTMTTNEGADRSVRRGTPVVPGIAVGPVIRPTATVDVSGAASVVAGSPEAEAERFASAVGAVAGRLDARSLEAHGVAAEVLQAQVGLVTDKGLRKAVEKAIAGGSSAEAAVVAAVDQFAVMFEQVGGLMAERVTDLRDLGGRVYAELQGLPEPGITRPDTPSILIAEDLAPADTSGLDPTAVIALATSLGGPTSHTAIIARQLGIPCVVAAPVDDIPAGTVVLVNGGNGDVVIDPDLDEAARLIEVDAKTRAAAAAWRGPGATADGVAIAIYANVQDGASARKAAETPCEGVGLFRSELAFLGRDVEPTVDEQAAEYGEVFAAFGERKVVIRTLDAGSDKPMKFATLPDEPNPALGVRGLRLSWGNPGLLSRQLDAIAVAAKSTSTSPWVMAPMVATASEAAAFAGQVRERGLTPGVMIEVPSAALLAHRLLEHVDFLSIGTNDLSQYTMAADRLSGELAGLTDSWQPAVLHLIAITAAAGKEVGKPVGVCGEAAADPLLACVLFGLGITSLSMATSALGQVGASLAAATSDECRAAANAAVAATDPTAARAGAAAALGR